MYRLTFSVFNAQTIHYSKTHSSTSTFIHFNINLRVKPLIKDKVFVLFNQAEIFISGSKIQYNVVE